jgi:serine/threonine protein kinase
MELAHDELFDHCVNVNGNGPMPEKGLQLAVRQLLRGLAHAHQRGIMHLDLKMENIMLKNPVTRADWAEAIDSPDALIQLKIMDYGFCEVSVGSDNNVSWAGNPPGTEGYRYSRARTRSLLVV